MPTLEVLTMMSQATLVVQLTLLLLVLMSLGSWSIIFYKLFQLSGARKQAREDMQAFRSAADLRGAVKVLGRDADSPAYQVALEGVHEINRMDQFAGPSKERVDVLMDNLRRALRQGVSQQIGRLSNSLAFLATCANAAPFIGLFGTVWGIMHAFQTIGQMKTAALAVVAPGISEALVATAIGLAVAIPATIAYNFFLGMLNRVETELVNFAGVFLNRVQRELPGLQKQEQAQL
jgi:biopolymer transport protein TolQ